MKRKKTLFLNLVLAVAITSTFANKIATQEQSPKYPPIRYTVHSLGTLGGIYSSAADVNKNGLAAGDADFPANQTEHAVIWRQGKLTDLGSLGGLNSFASSVNDQGLVAGAAQTSITDPLGEQWGSFFLCNPSGPCEGFQNLVGAFVWQNGVIAHLRAIGGNNAAAGFGHAVNNRGQVAGFAENDVQDPSCSPPQVLDFEAVIWRLGSREIQKLAPLPGDSVSAAFAINDLGQVVGASGVCGTPSAAISSHAVLWQDGAITDLGNFGGLMNNVAWAVNNSGEIVGFSDLAGDTTTHALLWRYGVMTDLGTLPGDVASFAFGINDERQIVGQSCDANGNCRAFLWQDGLMTDLNALIPVGSPLFLSQANSINDDGEIAGTGIDSVTGLQPGFLAIPCGQNCCAEESPADRAQDIPLDQVKGVRPAASGVQLPRGSGICGFRPPTTRPR